MKNYQLRQLFLGLLLLATTLSLMPANAFAATSEGQKPARQKQHRDDFIKEVKEMAIKKIVKSRKKRRPWQDFEPLQIMVRP